MTKISYRGYRFAPEIIQHAIWLYVRFTLSFRDIEDLLAERGIVVSHETVRRWVNHFGPAIAVNWLRTNWHHTEPPPGILGWRTGTNAAARATTGWRIRISPPGGGSARCNASKAWAQPKDFSPFMLRPTTPSIPNATSFRLKRTAPSGPRRWRHGIKRFLRREQHAVA